MKFTTILRHLSATLVISVLCIIHAYAQSEVPKLQIGGPDPSPEETAQYEARLRASYDARIQGEQALRQGKYDQAEGFFLKAIQIDNNPMSEMRLIDLYDRQNKMDREIDLYRHVIYPEAGGPSSSLSIDPAVRLHFVLLLTRLRRWEEAVPVYEEAISGHPNFFNHDVPPIRVQFRTDVWDIRKMQAITHLILGVSSPSYEEVSLSAKLVHLREAVKLQPKWGVAYVYLGFGLEQEGSLAEAESSYKKAVEFAVKEPEVRVDALKRINGLRYYRTIDALKKAKPKR